MRDDLTWTERDFIMNIYEVFCAAVDVCMPEKASPLAPGTGGTM